MLGIGKSKPDFEWAAHGKHPAFDDYFNLNTASPLANALSTWVEKGAKQNGTHHENRQTRSFRFWMRGIKKKELVLGILRDSSDRLGRPYPLFLLGQGIVKDWEKGWCYLFDRFDAVFRAFEEIIASRYESFREFETRLSRVSVPEHSGAGDEGSRLPETMMAWFKENREKGALSLSVAALLDRFAADPFTQTRSERGLFWKKAAVPGAVFLGGLPENPVLTIYARPLKTEDFFDLFNSFDTNHFG